MNKIFWFDTETTGIDPKNCSILQLAALIEVDNEIVEDYALQMRPHKDALIDPKALAVHGITSEVWQYFDDQKAGIKKLRKFLGRYVDKFNRNDKFIIAGYNVVFDVNMLRSTFLKDGDKFFGSWFFWPMIDVQTHVAEAIIKYNMKLPNYQLSTICKHLGIEIQAHEALSDIHATRELYKTLKSGAYQKYSE